MSMFTKMNGRDRNLLVLIIAVVIFYLCYKFVMAPFLAETAMIKDELDAVKSELSRAKELYGREDELKDQEIQLKGDIQTKYSVFLTDIEQSRLLNRLDIIATGTGLPITNFTPSPETVAQAAVETGFFVPQDYPLKNLALTIAPADTEDADATVGPSSGRSAAAGAVESEDMVPATDVTIGYEAATYESIYAFIGQVEKLNRTAFLKNLEINEVTGGLDGNMVFSFYSLPPIDSDQKDGLDFTPGIPQGKPNPFN